MDIWIKLHRDVDSHTWCVLLFSICRCSFLLILQVDFASSDLHSWTGTHRSQFFSNILHMEKFGAISSFTFNGVTLNTTEWFRSDHPSHWVLNLLWNSCLGIVCKSPNLGQILQFYSKESHRLSPAVFLCSLVPSQLKLITIPFVFLEPLFKRLNDLIHTVEVFPGGSLTDPQLRN